MTNVLVDVKFTVDVPENKVEGFVGRADDGTGVWWLDATLAAESWVRDNVYSALEYAGEPEVSCT